MTAEQSYYGVPSFVVLVDRHCCWRLEFVFSSLLVVDLVQHHWLAAALLYIINTMHCTCSCFCAHYKRGHLYYSDKKAWYQQGWATLMCDSLNWPRHMCCMIKYVHQYNNNKNNNRFTAPCPGLPGWAGTRRNIHPPTILIIIQS